MSKYSTIQRLLEVKDKPISDFFSLDYHELGYVLSAIEFDSRTPEFQRNLEIRNVPVDQLHPTQWEYDADRIPALPESDPDEHLPFVIDWHGQLVLSDGHHRVARAKQRGDKEIRARVLRVKDIYFPDGSLEPVVEYM